MPPADLVADFVVPAAWLAGLGMLTGALLRGWQGWLELRARELDRRHPAHDPAPLSMQGRIELADLRERIRKLEAIAAGVDL